MAKVKEKVKSSKFRNTAVIMLFLCFAQAVFLAYRWSNPGVMTISESIDYAVKDLSDPVEREKQKLRLAISHFVMRRQKLPSSYEQLVPEYSPDVPRNPKTGDEFYLVEIGPLNFQLASSLEEARLIKSKMGGVVRGDEVEDDLIDVASIKSDYIYNPSGKSDPFMPYGSRADVDENCKVPVECISLVKLKLSLIIDTGKDKRAMIETPDGKGHSVGVGTKIGNAKGEIVEIQADKVIVLEQHKDIAGNIHDRVYELRLREQAKEVEAEKKSSFK